MQQKEYIREVYSKKWATIREKLGFYEYAKNLCNFICQHIPKDSKILEVAIGTGYPFADFFQKKGYTVYGIDISPYLIGKCKRLNPNINCKVGDAEDLEYSNNYFDATYCFNSTWYFPNLDKAISEMIRVTRAGGMVIFDIQNRNNRDIAQSYRRALSESKGIRRLVKFARDIASAILLPASFNWYFLFHFVIWHFPTYPESIYKHLEERCISSFQVMVAKEYRILEPRDELGSFEDSPRLIFVIKK